MSKSDLLKVTEKEDIPYWDLPLRRKVEYIREICVNSLPNMSSNVAGQLANFINLYFLTAYGKDEVVAGYGLGSVYTGAFVLAMLISFNQGGTVLMAQAFGAKNYHACGVYLQKNAILLALIMTPLLALLLFADKISMAFGTDETLANLIVVYTRIMIPTMIGTALFDLMKSLLLSHKIFTPISYIQGATIVLHCVWAKVIIGWLGMGVSGAAVCRLISEFTGALLIYIYIKKSDRFKATWIPWTKEALNKEALISQVKFCMPIAAITYIGWVYYEIMTMISGTFGAKQVVTHVAVANTSTFNYCISIGIGTTIMTYIANSVGKQSIKEAKYYYYSGVTLVSIFTILSSSLLFFMRGPWARFWTVDPETQSLLLQMFMIFSFIGTNPDNFNNCFQAVLKAVGKQKTASILVFVSLYPVGVPIMILFAFVFGLEVKGLWIAFGISNSILAIANFLSARKVDWKMTMKEAKQRLNEESKSQEMKLLGSSAGPDLEDRK